MEKRFSFIISLLCLLTCSMSAQTDDVKWTEVSTADQMYDVLLKNTLNHVSTVNIRLVADIDMGTLTRISTLNKGYYFDTFDEFRGNLTGEKEDGSGCYSIKNMAMPLFPSIGGGAKITHLELYAFEVTGGYTEKQCALSMLTRKATIDDITFHAMRAENGKVTEDYLAAAVADAEETTFSNLKFHYCQFYSKNGYVGLVSGKATNCTFTNCKVDSTCLVQADGAYVGGLCGFADGCTFSNCSNAGTVSSIENHIGGIAGYSASSSSFTDCENTGVIKHYNSENGHNEIGGIAGTSTGGNFLRCVNEGSIYCSDNSAGGIVGKIDDGKVTACCNRAKVQGKENVGGIVGYLDRSYAIDCINQYYIYGSEHVGNIAGLAEDGTIVGCLTTSYVVMDAESSSSSRIMQGAVNNNVTLIGNCYSSYCDSEVNSLFPVSAQSLASGKVAVMLDSISASVSVSKEVHWSQNIGVDFYPLPLAGKGDLKAVTKADINERANYVQSVSTYAQMKEVLVNPASHISLSNDINLDVSTGDVFTIFMKNLTPFCGTIHGNGNALTGININIDSENTPLPKDIALFPVVSHATFDNLMIADMTISHNGLTLTSVGSLAGTSYNSIFSNIKIGKCEFKTEHDVSEVGGLVGTSNYDTFTDCSTRSTCKIRLYDISGICCGGITGKASESTFTRCYNNSDVYSISINYVGGIVGYAEFCNINHCLNTHGITGRLYCGGILGYGSQTTVTKCVNTGWIADYAGKRENYRGGILGCLDGDMSVVSNCMNFGSVNYADQNCGSTGHVQNGATGIGNYYYCQFNGNHTDNIGENIYAKILSGEFVYEKNNSYDWQFYQDLTNEKFSTTFPSPIPEAGEVFLNYQCGSNGKAAYTNNYGSDTPNHTTDNYAGYCRVCGRIVTPPASISIKSVDDFKAISFGANHGVDYSGSELKLESDLDMTGVTDFVSIGDSVHPFNGKFYGQGHHISNLNIKDIEDKASFFGYVSGNVVIDGLILDKTCSFKSLCGESAAVVMNVKSPYSGKSNVIISNCGNEATVSGVFGTAGIIYGIYGSFDNYVLKIKNCYNTGTIIAANNNSYACSAIVYLVNEHTTIENSWNSGMLCCLDKNHPFAGGLYFGSPTLKNCYDINTQYGVNKITANDIRYGVLCEKLNAKRDNNMSAWAQDIASDAYPTFGDAGLRYTRSISSQWGTAVLPFTVYPNDSVQLYTIDNIDANNVIHMKAVESVAHNTPCFFKVSDGIENILMFDTKGDCNYSNSLTKAFSTTAGTMNLIGTYTKEAISSSAGTINYYIADNKLWKSSSEFTLPAFRAYLQMSLSSAAKAGAVLTIANPDNEATAIGEISADGNITLYDQPVYNVAGQRQRGLQHGHINIVGGKKIYVK